MVRIRLAGLVVLCALGLSVPVRDASAAAEVHRFNLVLSAAPSSIAGGGFNDRLEEFSRLQLAPRGLEELESPKFGWLYDASFLYFVRPNFAVVAGVGQIRTQSKREFLPALDQTIQLRAEMLSVPVHVGGNYYLQPYNQGDFQARVFLGGGFESLVYNHARFQATEVDTDPMTTLGGTYFLDASRDSPGFYLEGGVHMFFAVRYSVAISGTYRSAKIRGLEPTITTPGGGTIPAGELFDLDMSGVGGKMAFGIGF